MKRIALFDQNKTVLKWDRLDEVIYDVAEDPDTLRAGYELHENGIWTPDPSAVEEYEHLLEGVLFAGVYEPTPIRGVKQALQRMNEDGLTLAMFSTSLPSVVRLGNEIAGINDYFNSALTLTTHQLQKNNEHVRTSEGWKNILEHMGQFGQVVIYADDKLSECRVAQRQLGIGTDIYWARGESRQNPTPGIMAVETIAKINHNQYV